VKNKGALRILFLQIIHSLRTENPVLCVEVRLEDGWAKVLFAFDFEDCLNLLKENVLFLNALADILNLRATLIKLTVDLLKLLKILPGLVKLVQDFDFFLVSKLLTCRCGLVKGIDEFVLEIEDLLLLSV